MNQKKKTFKFLLILKLLTLCILIIANTTSPYVYAKNTNTESSSSSKDIVEQVEEERILKLKKELSLTLPETIDNPSYAITFVNPSPQKPVEVTIDGKVYSKIKSPFLLPNLTFGKHTLIFKFTNKDGLIRVLTTEVLVVPRPPKFDDSIKSEFKAGDQISLSGTATPNSKVLLVVNSQKVYKIDVDLTGKWSFLLKDLESTDLHLLAFTVKNGIVSDNYSKLEIKFNNNAQKDSDSEQRISTGDKIVAWINSLKDWVYNNLETIKIVGGVILGLTLLIIAIKIKKKLDSKRDEKTLAELLSKQISNKPDILEVIKDVKDSNIDINKLSKGQEKIKTSPSKQIKHSKKKRTKDLKEDSKTQKRVKIKKSKQNEDSKDLDIKETKKSRKSTKIKKPILRLSFGKKENVKNRSATLENDSKKSVKSNKKSVESKKSKKKGSSDSKIDSIDTVKASKKVLSKEEFLKRFKKIDK